MGIHLSRVRGEEEGSTRLLHNRLLLCSMLWLAGSWQKVVGTSGGCLQTAGEAAKKIQTEPSVPILVSQFLFPFPSLQPLFGRELRMPGETAGQGKGRSCRINSKMLHWRARKN